MIDYKEYVNKGYFIGSGVIECANKYVFQERIKLPGMRWHIDSAQYVANLRAKLMSGFWDDVEKAVYTFINELNRHDKCLIFESKQ